MAELGKPRGQCRACRTRTDNTDVNVNALSLKSWACSYTHRHHRFIKCSGVRQGTKRDAAQLAQRPAYLWGRLSRGKHTSKRATDVTRGDVAVPDVAVHKELTVLLLLVDKDPLDVPLDY